jgi:hypothetical protein
VVRWVDGSVRLASEAGEQEGCTVLYNKTYINNNERAGVGGKGVVGILVTWRGAREETEIG